MRRRSPRGCPAASSRPLAAAAPDAGAPDLGDGFDVTISNPHGLHARPATAFVEIAKSFQATVRVRHGDKVADGKSLISLLKLGAENGATLRVMAEGPDAAKALATLKAAIEHGLEDEAEAAADAATPVVDARQTIRYEARTAAGISASPGLAIGPIRQFVRAKIVVEATARDSAGELKKLDRAIESAKRELQDLFDEVWKKSGPAKAGIFKAHAEFLDDPEMLDAARGADPRRPQRRLGLAARLRGARRHPRVDEGRRARRARGRPARRRPARPQACSPRRSRTNRSFRTSR